MSCTRKSLMMRNCFDNKSKLVPKNKNMKNMENFIIENNQIQKNKNHRKALYSNQSN